MRHHILLRVISSIAIPFIFMFGFYVLFHGKVSPGGGFQGGAICATAFILHAMIFGVEQTKRIVSLKKLRILASFGSLLFCGFGFLTFVMGGSFLEYNVLAGDDHLAHFIGVMGIEIGVQLTVFAVLTMVFLTIAGQEDAN